VTFIIGQFSFTISSAMWSLMTFWIWLLNQPRNASLSVARWPTSPTTSLVGSMALAENSPCTIRRTRSWVCGSITSPTEVPNLIDGISRVVTKNTSQMKTLPPVNLSTSWPRNGMFEASSVCRPAEKVPTYWPFLKNSATSS
jgi:hypothetical protein